MANQFISLEDAGANCDHLRAHAPSGPDIFWRVSNEADEGILPQSLPGLLHALPKYLDSQFRMIAKTTESEEGSQTGGSDFVPAYRFQISGSTSWHTTCNASGNFASKVSPEIPIRSSAARRIPGSVFP